jgi:2-desacetyl-2-hydroxyethyl bacteriochlorophyllide A dehydrogenase
MRAALFLREHQIEVRELPDPKPGPEEALIRVTACGICGTDVHIFDGRIKEDVRPPVVMGHEIAGVVESVGGGVHGLQTGQTVAVDPVIACGACEYCRVARLNLCQQMTTIGYVRNGGYAQFLVAPATHVYPLKPGTPAEAAILVETLACVLNGYEKLDLQPGRTAMILGAGTVGLLWNHLLKASPITHLVQSEPVAFRRERAHQLGADTVIDPATENLAARVSEVAPEGIDYIIDASGEAQAVQEGIKLVKKGGTFVIFGVCPVNSTIQVDPHEVYQKEMRIIGSKMPPYRLQRAAEMIQAGMIDYEQLITDVLPLSELAEACRTFESRRDRQIKVAIDPWAE